MIDATRRNRLAVVGAFAAALLVSGCTAENPDPSPSPSRTASRTPSPSPSPTPSATAEETPTPAPSPDPTVFPSPQVPSEGTASDGWTYAQLSSICQEWVLTREPRNADEQWNFDAGFPAQRYGPVWDIGFDGSFTLPNETTRTEGFIGCAVTGTPADYSVGLSEASGDAAPDEVLRP